MLNRIEFGRPACRDDAAHLARLINIAGEDMPIAFWQELAGPGGDAWAIGRERAGRDSGGFSWRNALVAEADGKVAGTLIAYAIDERAGPEDYASMPEAFVPLQQLKDEAVGSYHVNVLACYREFRDRGFGTGLLRETQKAAGSRPMSIIVSEANVGARRLYEREGFRVRDSRLATDRQHRGGNWLLMLT